MIFNISCIGCFRTCHAIAKHRRPFTDYVWQCTLDAQKGLDVGNTYRNDKACKQFVRAIAEVERRHLAQHLESAHFLALISDGTTDASITEAEIVYVRYAVNGVVSTAFAGIENVGKADAPSIKRAIDGVVERYLHIPKETLMKKLVGFGSDGAAVMTGSANGVATLFRNEQPCLQAIHCYAHRLELAYKDALCRLPMYTKLSGLLLSLYLFYHHSPLNRSNLKAAFDTLSLPCALPPRVGGTRWLPHLLKALQALVKGYPAYVLHLTQMQVPGGSGDAKAKAIGFLATLHRRDIIEMAHFLLDVLFVLSKLSLVAQTVTATVADVHATLTSVVATLVMYKTTTTAKERALARMEDFHGETLTGAVFAKQTRLQILGNLVSCLEGRFVDSNSDVVRASSIVSFKLWPEAAGDYGNDAVATLNNHFGPVLRDAGIDTASVETEWTLLKMILYEQSPDVRQLTWSSVNAAHQAEYGNILGLVDAILTLPASSADAERGFSQLKLTKSSIRSVLKADRLTDLLTIQLSSPDIAAFEPKEAIELWSAGGARRPDTQPLRPRPDCSSYTDSSDTDCDDSSASDSE